MALPNEPDACYAFINTLKDCGYQWVLVQEHTVERPENGAGLERRHLPHRLVCRNSRGEEASSVMSKDWPLWEVFLRARGGLCHRHVGSVHAPDAELAIRHARDAYTRREEGISMWVVRSTDIVASDPGDSASLFEPAADKVYRHPTFYDLPDELKHM